MEQKMTPDNKGVVVNFSLKNSSDGIEHDDLDLRASLDEAIRIDDSDEAQKLLPDSGDLEKNAHANEKQLLRSNQRSNHSSGST